MKIPVSKMAGPIVAAGLLVGACGEPVEFNAMDAEGLATILDAGMTEDSGLQGLITADLFSEDDVAEFNVLAEDACADLSDGISTSEYDEFEAGVLDGAEEMKDMIDTDALTLALVDATCPSYVDSLTEAMNG
ncbi:MAG: hypothetical protein AAF531_25730 [Actinomycetota bacterium]